MLHDVQLKTINIGDLVVSVLDNKGDGSWYSQRKTFEEKASPLYRFIACEDFVNFVDVGANYGFVSMLARRAAPGLKILSIEADPRLARMIEPNFRANGMRAPVVANCVAGDSDEQKVSFSLNPSSTLDNRVRMAQWAQVQVPMTRVSTLMQQHGLTGKAFFKIDTQGFELHVLLGLEPWLLGQGDWVLKMEFAPHWLRSQGTDPLELLRYLHARYEVVEFPERIVFGTPGIDALFSYPTQVHQLDSFLEYVSSLNKDGLGWVDLLVRPRQSGRSVQYTP